MKEETKPFVSICTMTKDLAEIIGDGIESWLAQQTNFPYEIVLSDDYSTDNTVAVVKEYQQKNPDTIRILTSDKPLGLGKNWLKCMKACKGKYIAFCDGDDLWTDPLKLQKQVDYLEQNPGCNLVCADYDYISETGVFIESEWKKGWYGKKFDLIDNLGDSVATTLTIVIRKSSLDPFLDSMTVDNHPFIWDTVLWAYCLQTGYGYFYPEKLAHRRVQANGAYTTKPVLDRAFIDVKSIYSTKLFIKDKKALAFLDKSLYALNIAIAKENLKLGKGSKARVHLLNSAVKWNGLSAVKNNIKYIYWFFKSFSLKLA